MSGQGHPVTPDDEHGTMRCDGCRELAQVTRIAQLEAIIAAQPHSDECRGWIHSPWDGGNWPNRTLDPDRCDCWKADAS